VLLQAGKGSGISGLFGGGGSDQLFNAPSGMAFVKKVTVVMAIAFMLTSLSLTIFSSRLGTRSVTNQIPYIPVVPQPQPQGK
jgi:preprotein translocase subunit SecG